MPHGRYENLWERLLAFLGGWGSAREVQPGRIALELRQADGTTRVIEVLMTEGQWDDMVSVAWGGFGAELQMYLRERVSGLRPEERFLIYSEYDLIPSAGAALAEDPEEERLAELARSHPEGFGRWYATDEHGKVVDAHQAPQDPTQEPPDDAPTHPSR